MNAPLDAVLRGLDASTIDIIDHAPVNLYTLSNASWLLHAEGATLLIYSSGMSDHLVYRFSILMNNEHVQEDINAKLRLSSEKVEEKLFFSYLARGLDEETRGVQFDSHSDCIRMYGTILRLKFLAPIDKSTKKEETIVEEDQVDSEERVQFHSILEKAGIIRQNGNSKPECDSGFNSQASPVKCESIAWSDKDDCDNRGLDTIASPIGEFDLETMPLPPPSEREASICSSMTLDGISSGGGGVQVMMENEGEHDEAKSETSGSTYFRDWFGNSNFNFTIPKVTPTLPKTTSLVCDEHEYAKSDVVLGLCDYLTVTSGGEVEVEKEKYINGRAIKSECDFCISPVNERHEQFDEQHQDPLAAALMDILSEPAFRQKICEGLQQQQQSRNVQVVVENN